MVRNNRHGIAIASSYVLVIPVRGFRPGRNDQTRQRIDAAFGDIVVQRNFIGFGVKNGSTRTHGTTT
ncbi:hypothetical protein WT01_08530 [Burkholderia cepacia]|uniref:Uncharacterized protein n=1 Tax=Burkholderia cepacia TaxID=292 RepID=A0A103UKT6_BURCE|nr:hypothetical protein WS88_13760 [Burkholderia cepacia]KVK85556.1 hypothetical protein WS90_08885 [Burkholderia cepacia]KVK90383.1 hypothetical protein WS93_36190 [Burkholderia cepacia]KVL62925.1 hypothetical protein WT01_08530 [Burkholderia cepacia]